jgi:hypothetical protein
LFSAFNSEALTARTTHVIEGSAPYLTFDGGVTKVTDTGGLLGITIPGIGNIKPNDPRASTIIELPRAGMSFNDIGMLVPPNTNTVSLSTLIGPPNNYWRDDDGDDNVSVTGGRLTLTITDNDGNPVTRGETLTICKSPYTLKLESTAGTLRTHYGVPNSRSFSGRIAIYQLKSKDAPAVCFARPNLQYGQNYYRGPLNIWNPDKGFLPQSTDPAHYDKNFPTTGANGLYFDLDIGGVNAADLTWTSAIHRDITASVTLNGNMARVTLTGPDKNNAASKERLLSPATFELIARKNGSEVLRYGFVLKQWFVSSGSTKYNHSDALSFCRGMNYQMPRVRDLTNAVRDYNSPISGALPPASGNHYMRYIGSGFFTEWGRMNQYTGSGFASGYFYWTSDVAGSNRFLVELLEARADPDFPYRSRDVVCASVLRTVP